MKDLLVLLAHLLTTIAKLLGPGGARAVVADSLLMKQQLLVINRSRRQAPDEVSGDHQPQRKTQQLFMDITLQRTFSDSSCRMI